VGFDGDAALTFQVHGVEDLRLHLARGERSGKLEQTVRQRGFTVVDMRDDGKVAKESGIHRLKADLYGLTFDFNRRGAGVSTEYLVPGTQYPVRRSNLVVTVIG
jgi:hypothetical protein